jgi:hypothetical protein
MVWWDCVFGVVRGEGRFWIEGLLRVAKQPVESCYLKPKVNTMNFPYIGDEIKQKENKSK